VPFLVNNISAVLEKLVIQTSRNMQQITTDNIMQKGELGNY
jgi:hypothetical protein